MQLGDVIRGKYRLLRLLGDGGMGSVYEASHELLGTRVAIKVLHADLARRTGLIERFMQEARVAAQIKSPHVVQVTDIDRTPEGQAYIVMELLEGEPLSAMLDRIGKVPIPTACDFTAQILEALESAHALGVVHRDLKPENVFLTPQGGKTNLKLIDFGIAKLKTNVPGERSLTVAGVLMGTAEYMAPEQAFSADKVDARSDLYAVGVMLYEMIAGRRPVSGEDARTIAMKVERGEAVPLVHVAPETPREIAGLVHRAMAARPELRFASATEMRIALDGALTGKRAPTVPLPAHKTTVQAAPANAAFAPAPEREAPPRTERAPAPLVFAPPVPPSPVAHSAVTAEPRSIPKRRGGAGMWALIVTPLLLGAGVVVAFVVTAERGASEPPAPTLTASPPATLTSIPTAAPTPSPTDTIAPLVPSPRTPPAPPRATDGGRAHAPPGAPSDSAYTPPPFTFPTSLPFPFPGDGGIPQLPFPLPSGFPTSFPSALPSTLPFSIPAPEVPSAAPAPSSSSQML